MRSARRGIRASYPRTPTDNIAAWTIQGEDEVETHLRWPFAGSRGLVVVVLPEFGKWLLKFSLCVLSRGTAAVAADTTGTNGATGTPDPA